MWSSDAEYSIIIFPLLAYVKTKKLVHYVDIVLLNICALHTLLKQMSFKCIVIKCVIGFRVLLYTFYIKLLIANNSFRKLLLWVNYKALNDNNCSMKVIWLVLMSIDISIKCAIIMVNTTSKVFRNIISIYVYQIVLQFLSIAL